MEYKDILTASIENADRRLAEPRDFVVNAIADYENGLTTGFKDGAEWMRRKALSVFFDYFKGNPNFVRLGWITEIAHTLNKEVSCDRLYHTLLDKILQLLAEEEDIEVVFSKLADFFDNLYKTEQL